MNCYTYLLFKLYSTTFVLHFLEVFEISNFALYHFKLYFTYYVVYYKFYIEKNECNDKSKLLQPKTLNSTLNNSNESNSTLLTSYLVLYVVAAL